MLLNSLYGSSLTLTPKPKRSQYKAHRYGPIIYYMSETHFKDMDRLNMKGKRRTRSEDWDHSTSKFTVKLQ